MGSQIQKILGQAELAATTVTQIYVVAGKSSTSNEPVMTEAYILLCSNTASSITYRLYVVPEADSQGDEHRIAWDVSIKAAWGTHRYGPIFLLEGDEIYARASATGLVVTITGVEQDFEDDQIGPQAGGV